MSAKVNFAALLAFVGIGISPLAFAVPIVVDFTGAGSVCTYTGFLAGKTCEGKSFVGTITYEIVGPTPIPAGPSPTRAISLNGWVNSSFEMNWDTGSYASASVPILLGNVATQGAQVLDNNEGIFDGIVLSRENKSLEDSDLYENSFSVALFSRVLSWQNGLDFPRYLEMPPTDPIFGPVTEFEFKNYSILDRYSGYFGSGNITSLTTRLPTTTVAEPESAALLAMGLVALSVRRRRASVPKSSSG